MTVGPGGSTPGLESHRHAVAYRARCLPLTHRGGTDPLMDASTLQLIILPAGLIAVLFAIYLARDVLARDTGTEAMQDVAGTIYEGAVAFIRRQYTTIAILAVVGAVLIAVIIAVI